MLRSLHLRDFVIVDQNQIEFGAGFTVFSGETGAGKSILIDALSLVLGGRGDSSVIRQGAERTEIIATFTPPSSLNRWLTEHDIEVEDELILRRLIDLQGRSRAYINGTPCSIAQLRELGSQLIDIHGQHAHQSLLNPQSQYTILDTQGQHLALSQQVHKAWQQWQQAQQAYDRAQDSAQSHQQELELLDWQVQQLQDLNLQAGDWEQLSQEHQRLAHAQSLLDSAGQTLNLLEADSGVLDQLNTALHQLQSVLSHDPNLQNIYQTLESAQIACVETVSDLNSYLSDVELDPERLEHIDQHMSAAFNLARKHKCEPEELPQLLDQLLNKQQQLQLSIDLDALLVQLQSAQSHYQHVASELSQARLQTSQQLSTQVSQAMQQLSMQGGQFVIALTACEPSAQGLEKVEFLVAGHQGVPPAPLAKVASGGELSRISLALSVIASQAARVPTLIFDEVDSGIGGAVAEVVGRLLHELGQRHQVLCVTHLPHLKPAERIEEISRMLGGIEITSTTREHAKEILGLNH